MEKKGKGMKGESYAVPAEKLTKIQDSSAKMGYKQTFGASRKSPGKKADMTTAAMMGGADAAAKYYDGAGKYMNGAAKYTGVSRAPMKHIPSHTDPVPAPGSEVPSYNQSTTTQTNTTSGGGNTSSGKSYSSAYNDADKNKYPTLESFTVAAKAYNKNNPKPVVKPKAKSTATTTTQVGDKSTDQVVEKGNEYVQNAQQKRAALKEAALIKAQNDSTAVSNKLRKQVTHDGQSPLSQRQADIITTLANRTARRSLGHTRIKNVKNVTKSEAIAAFPLKPNVPSTRGGNFTEEDIDG